MKSQKQFYQRPQSHNPESKKQEHSNQIQNEKFLSSIIKLQNQIEELKYNQQIVSESLTNNLTNINNKINTMESLINELSYQPQNTLIDYLKQSNEMLKQSQTQNNINMNTSSTAGLFLEQQQKNIESKFSSMRVWSHQSIQPDNKKINRLVPNIKSDQNNQQKQKNQGIIKNLYQLNQCILCKEKDHQLIETPCNHFFHKKCLQQLFDQQLMDYEHKKQFKCICKQELHSKLFIRHLQIDKEMLFEKQINIIYQNNKKIINQCQNCNIIWIYDIFQKTNERCFKCGKVQMF
ncbi:unnamed protein product [Paramecium primaurelia]|uniref:RING-type domain-containing protein n=1 Tax=Paramecium primaurelia TaxID=5886 RepID=A0A8S1QC62_PARPR|nr:unnamed protein product [Paramecium primaurelia]